MRKSLVELGKDNDCYVSPDETIEDLRKDLETSKAYLGHYQQFYKGRVKRLEAIIAAYYEQEKKP